MKKCHSCQESWDGSPGSQPGRAETCSSCGVDLHCCLNCKLYDSSAANQCSSRTTEAVKNKEKGNYCDEFEFSQGRGGGKKSPPQDDMESKWKNLFNG